MNQTTRKPSFSIVRFLGLLAIAVLLATYLFVRFGVSSAVGGLKPGAALPNIAAEGWLYGSAPAQAELKGKVLVVVAYAHWCGPCRQEAPELVNLHKEFAEADVQFIGLTSSDSSELAETQAFLNEYEITWLNGYGAIDTLMNLEAQYIPCVWVVGKDGIITWNVDSERYQSLKAAIEEALR